MGALLVGRWALQPGSVPRLLLAAAVLVVGALATHVVGRLAARRRIVSTLTRGQPHQRAQVAAMVRRAIPLVGRPRPRVGPIPDDPFALTQVVVVPPLGDGRPGERFRAPGPNRRIGPPSIGTSREDAQVVLARASALNVVCFGRIGAVGAGHPVRPAAQRTADALRVFAGEHEHAGTRSAVDGPFGQGWHRTVRIGRRLLSEVHVDHGGWAFAVGVTAPEAEAHVMAVLDRVLATWEWIDDGGTPVVPPAAWDRLPSDPVAGGDVVAVGPDRAPSAWFGAPGPRLPLLEAPGPDGTRDEAFVPVTPTCDLLVWSAPLGPLANDRLAATARPAFGDPTVPAGPVVPLRTAAGPAVRRRFAVRGAVVHEVQLDRAGRGWTVRLVHAPDEEHLVPVLDRVLATWRWADEPTGGVGATAADPP